MVCMCASMRSHNAAVLRKVEPTPRAQRSLDARVAGHKYTRGIIFRGYKWRSWATGNCGGTVSVLMGFAK